MPARIYVDPRTCENCEDQFVRTRYPGGRLESLGEFHKRRFCSRECYWEWNQGENHHNYVDGFRRGHDWGYLRYSDGTYVHRAVMEEKLGRPLESHEHVHHIDHDPTNNDPSNLELLSNSHHKSHHAKQRERDDCGRFAA